MSQGVNGFGSEIASGREAGGELEASRLWWERTKREPGRLLEGLVDQHRGEASAAGRIRRLGAEFAAGDRRARRILGVIAAQERKHAEWVAGLLRARGIDVAETAEAAERYWPEVLKAIDGLETGCAVGAHAERMRLWRIEVIAGDSEAPRDVREVFLRILPEERFHERALRRLAGAGAMARTAGNHARGAAALGLLP